VIKVEAKVEFVQLVTFRGERERDSSEFLGRLGEIGHHYDSGFEDREAFCCGWQR